VKSAEVRSALKADIRTSNVMEEIGHWLTPFQYFLYGALSTAPHDPATPSDNIWSW
jgi:hypothetical protein